MQRLMILGVALLSAAPVHAFDFTGLETTEIRQRVGTGLAQRAAELSATSATRTGAIEAVVNLVDLRSDAFKALSERMRMTSIEAIVLADAIDDSLVKHLDPVFDAYREANADPIRNAGAEKFLNAVKNIGFVGVQATGFLVHLEMQQSFLILSDFRARRSEVEVEGAEDAFLRHYGLLCDLYDAQHEELEDLHACNIANMEWAIGRVQTDDGVGNFFLANQFLSYKDEELSYMLKLQSQDTGEVIDVRYPLPWMTRLDPGWQELQQKKKQ